MAFATQNLTPINTADADFRAWGSALSAQLAAMGLIQTADTGQINWTTVLKPAAANTVAGYEIWRFNDSLQATSPVFIKIEYGSADTQLTPSLWLTIGNATNAAGTLSGTQLTTRTQMKPTASSAVAQACYFSGSTNRISVGLFVGSVAAQSLLIYFNVERVRNESGVETSDTALTFGEGNSVIVKMRVLTQSGAIPPAESTNTGCSFFNTASASAIYGTEVVLGQIFPQKGKLLPPLLGLLLYPSTYLTIATIFTTTMYGAIHTYIALGHAGSFAGGSFLPYLAMRYE